MFPMIVLIMFLKCFCINVFVLLYNMESLTGVSILCHPCSDLYRLKLIAVLSVINILNGTFTYVFHHQNVQMTHQITSTDEDEANGITRRLLVCVN